MELLVVAVGILIAFTVQQWAEDRTAARKARAAETRIEIEVRDNAKRLMERVMLRQCLSNRLSELSVSLRDNRQDWNPMSGQSGTAVGPLDRRIYRTPLRPWIRDSYESSLQNGDLNALPVERRAMLATLYREFQRANDINQAETDLAVGLDVLRYNPDLSQQEINAHLASIAKLEFMNSVMVIIAEQSFDTYKRLNYAMSPSEVRKSKLLSEWNGYLAERESIYGRCIDRNAPRKAEPHWPLRS
jgi:hypothetical protein